MAGRSGMRAYHRGLYLDPDLFMDHGTNGISEFRYQVSNTGGPTRSLGWSRGCRSGIARGQRRAAKHLPRWVLWHGKATWLFS